MSTPEPTPSRPPWWSRQYIEPFTLDDDELWRIIRTAGRAAVAWVTRDCQPVVAQLSYCWYDDHIWLTSTTNRHKYRAWLRNPGISLSITDPADWFRQVTIRGRVTIFDDREAVHRFIHELITAGGRRHVPPETYTREFERFDSPHRKVMRVEIERIRSYDGRKMWAAEATNADPWGPDWDFPQGR